MVTTTSARLEDVMFLIEQGEAPEQVAARMGVRPDSVARLLHRHGRTDLARPLWALARRERYRAEVAR